MTQLAFNLDETLHQVKEATDPAWIEDALAAVHRVCLSRADFHVDDIWDAGLASTRNDKALGPVMMAAKKNGWCIKTDRVRPSKRSHYSGKPVWRSLLYRGAVAQ